MGIVISGAGGGGASAPLVGADKFLKVDAAGTGWEGKTAAETWAIASKASGLTGGGNVKVRATSTDGFEIKTDAELWGLVSKATGLAVSSYLKTLNPVTGGLEAKSVAAVVTDVLTGVGADKYLLTDGAGTAFTNKTLAELITAILGATGADKYLLTNGAGTALSGQTAAQLAAAIAGLLTYTSSRIHVNETFDGLATGAINGLGSYHECGAWASTLAGTSTANVAVKAGADKMLTITQKAGDGGSLTKVTVTNTWGFSTGTRWSFDTRMSANTIDKKFVVYDGATLVFMVYNRGASTAWNYWNGSGRTEFLACANNTWYHFDIIQTGDNAYNVWVDGVWYHTGSGVAVRKKDAFSVEHGGGGAGDNTLDFDNLVIINPQLI